MPLPLPHTARTPPVQLFASQLPSFETHCGTSARPGRALPRHPRPGAGRQGGLAARTMLQGRALTEQCCRAHIVADSTASGWGGVGPGRSRGLAARAAADGGGGDGARPPTGGGGGGSGGRGSGKGGDASASNEGSGGEQQQPASGPLQPHQQHLRRRQLLADMARSALLWVGGLSAVTAAMLAAAPSLLSQPLGLQVLC